MMEASRQPGRSAHVRSGQRPPVVGNSQNATGQRTAAGFQEISDIFNNMGCKQVERQAYQDFLKLVYETAKDLLVLCS
jgi:hypothetical protein